MKKASIKDYIREEIEAILREKKIKFKRKAKAPIKELESTANAQDDQKVAQLQAQKADKEKQKAGVDGEIAKLKQQIDAIEKK
jgi:hypothetical protein